MQSKTKWKNTEGSDKIELDLAQLSVFLHPV